MRMGMAEDEKAHERRHRLVREEVGRRLKAARGGRPMEEVAEETGLPSPTLYRYEGGKMLPGLDKLPMLRRGYGVSYDDLVPDEPEAA